MEEEAQAVTPEDFAGLLTGAAKEQPETDSETEDEEQDESPEVEADADKEADEADEDADEETEEAEQPATDSAETILTFKDAEGKEVQVKAVEALQAYKDRELQRADYTRKTQTLAQEREQAQAQFKQQFQFVEQFSAEVGQLQAAQQRLAALQGIDWNRAFDEDPVAASKLNAEMVQLTSRTQLTAREIEQKRAYMQHVAQQEDQQAFSKVWEHMHTVDPAFTRDRLVSMIESANKAYGVPAEVLANIKEPRLVQMWNDLAKKAEAYDRLQQSKPSVTKKVAAAPTKVTKTAPATKPAGKLETQIKRLQQTGSVNDFAAALAMTRR